MPLISAVNTTPNTGQTLIVPGQAKGGLVANTMHAIQDYAFGWILEDLNVDDPSSLTPSWGDAWGIGDSPVGDWDPDADDAHAGKIAAWFDAWHFVQPSEGTRIILKTPTSASAPFDDETWYELIYWSGATAIESFVASSQLWIAGEHLAMLGYRDGARVYSKTIDIGALPASGTKSVNHSITGLDVSKPVRFEGWAEDGTRAMPIPIDAVASTAIPGGRVVVHVNATQVVVRVNQDFSNYDAKVRLEYSKT